jgi:predicted ATP-grasp superfamily ATP-dependent carboligase
MRTLFVYEFVSGGGFAGRSAARSLRAEGWAMLHALLGDLVRLGGRRIVTCLDERLDGAVPDGVHAVRVRTGEHQAAFDRLAGAADACWIVAPETDGILADLTARAEALGAAVIGCPADAVRAASDKLALGRRLWEAGVPVPPTWSAHEADEAVRAAGFPLVVKPVTGAGCEGVRLVGGPAALARALEEDGGTGRLAQLYIEGIPASVSLLCTGGRAVPLSLNGQEVRVVGASFVYEGGQVPLAHPQATAALDAARRACEVVPGLRGYVGVDLVVSEEGPFVIEINPRLTTSYVGLREATDDNLAALALAAAERGELPESLSLTRAVRFTAAGRLETAAA